MDQDLLQGFPVSVHRSHFFRQVEVHGNILFPHLSGGIGHRVVDDLV